MIPAPSGRSRYAPGLTLLAVVLFLYAPELPPDRTFWYRDIAGFWAVLADGFVRVVREGSLPLWNRNFSFGMPMLADPGVQTLYPFTWLNLLLPLSVYYKAFVVAHAFLAALGLYRLARRALGRSASTLAGVAWLTSGPFQELVSQPHHFCGAAWLPWVLLALETVLTRPSWRSGRTFGVVAAMQVLAGSGDLCLMTAFIGAGWTLARLWPVPGSGLRPVARALLGVGVPLALLLSAVQWLPTVDLLRSSGRVGMQSKTNTYWSLHPASLAELFVPRLLSDLPLSEATRATLYESREPLYATLYLGCAALVLLVFGLVPARAWLARLGLAGLATALLAALGRYTPLYAWLVRFTPLAILRYPTKYTIAAAFFWALLCGAAAENWLTEGPSVSRRRRAALVSAGLALAAAVAAIGVWLWPEIALHPWLAGGAVPRAAAAAQLTGKLGLVAALAGAMGIGLARLRRGSRWLTLPLVLVAADLTWAAHGVNDAAPLELLEYRPALARTLPPGSRVYVSQARPARWLQDEVVRIPRGWQHSWAVARGREELLWPPLGGRFGYRGSFDGDFTGLASPLLSNLTLILQGAEGTPLASRLLRTAGVDYVVTVDETAWPELEPVVEVPSYFRRPIRLLRVPGTRPELLLVGRWRVAAEPESFHVLGSAGFDPALETILASGPLPAPSDVAFAGHLEDVERGADTLRLRARANAPCLLLFLQAFHPGWQAFVDGQPVKVVRADILFQAIAVPAGEHVVEFRYRPRSVFLGAALTGVGILVLACLELRRRPDAV